jgi:TIR domain-containing protein
MREFHAASRQGCAMSITIRHLDGPLAGQEQHFDNSVAVIAFGRSLECQVVYPPDCADVGRKHFALGRTAHGDYQVELFGKRYVAIDGVPAEDGMLVRSGSVIRLGRPDGPSFKVELQSQSVERESWMADIALEAEVDTDDFLEPSPAEKEWASSVDLLFRRKSQPPAVVTGVPSDAALRPDLESESPVTAMRPPPLSPPVRVGAADRPRGSLDPWFEDLLRSSETQSRPKGVGSGGPPQSSQPERYSDAPQNHPAPPEVRAEYAPEAQMRMRHGRALFWWIALALGAGLVGYWLFGRGIALGAALGKLFPAAVPPPPAPKETKADLVDVSVFGPTAIKAGSEGLIQVFLHRLGQREIAKALAQETDPDATRRGVQTLAGEIAQGQRVEIMLDARGLGVDQEMQTLVWRGEPCACQFTLSAPEDAAGRTIHPRVLVLVDSVPVGSLTFALKVTAEAVRETEPGLRGDRARRYSYAFLSYASPDRAEVFKRAQGLKAGGTSFFNDLLSLDPGERWEKRLYEEIDRCDVFYLFWSSKAKASEWVMKETEYALARRLTSENGDPDIIPVIIEGPPPPSPPESLKEIHFNDNLLYVLAAVGDGRAGSGN